MSVASNRMGGLEIFTSCNFTIGHVRGKRRGGPVPMWGQAPWAVQSSEARQRRARRNSPGGKACQQAAGLAEPRAFAAAKIDRHGRLLVENLTRPFASFGGAPLRLQEQRVVVIGFGDGGN